MNTQRPEWNDANNALVGNGVSMVTLYYLRRFLKFWHAKFADTQLVSVQISEEVRELFDNIFKLFTENTGVLENGFSEKERKYFTDKLGESGTNYRNAVYQQSFSGNKKAISAAELTDFAQLSLAYVDQSIKVNKRYDGLFHAYNLISFSKNGVLIRHLYEMLEGQVSVLSSGYLNAEESLDVLNALKSSSLFRSDQYSYLLYPDRELPRFSEKNNIPIHRVQESKLLSKLIAKKDTSILSTDQSGHYHFNGSFRNADVLDEALSALDKTLYGELVIKEKNIVLDIFEEIFDHQSFTGRSGTFYGYEGLGSIYWHMVSKLLLATEESIFKALDEDADPGIVGDLKDHYYEIKAGIGLYKSPELYGAFPTDAYSHTPGNSGARQPGMTGQVKEDFISRMGELGVRIKKGEIVFDTSLINPDEFLDKESIFKYYSPKGKNLELQLDEKQLAFTICQVPMVYKLSNDEKITVFSINGQSKEIKGTSLNIKTSSSIFNRKGEIERIEISIKQ